MKESRRTQLLKLTDRVDFGSAEKNSKKPPPDHLNERREASLILERYLGGDERNIKKKRRRKLEQKNCWVGTLRLILKRTRK